MATESARESEAAAQPQDPELILDTAAPDEFERDQQPPWLSSGLALRASRRATAAQSLGYLSLALGLGALLTPGRVARITGLEQHRRLLPLIGARELASGIGLLSAAKSEPWLWSRVVGDGMD